MKTTYLFANWKMYLDFDESNILANALANEAKNMPANVKMAIFPSALSWYSVGQVLRDVKIGVGAQNIYWVDKGGYTGEVSAQMYKNVGCQYALIGHSERRHQFGETNHEVRQKLETALTVGLVPVLCVGENEQERNNGRTEEVVEIQLRSALSDLAMIFGRELFIAYEPVWAISKSGVGVSCDSKEAERMHKIIREITSNLLKEVNLKVLYGGSARSTNIGDFIKSPEIDGVLVGAASTKLDSWLEMIKKCN